VQVTIAHFLRVRGVEPSFVLVAVVWYAIRADTRRAAAYGLAAGICEDILAAGTGGAWTVSTTLVAMLASTLSRGFFADSLGIVATITAFVTLVRNLVFWLVMGFEGYPPGLAVMRFHEAILQAALNALAIIVAMLIARSYENYFL
jgi:rod shape-determining protein MreD